MVNKSEQTGPSLRRAVTSEPCTAETALGTTAGLFRAPQGKSTNLTNVH